MASKQYQFTISWRDGQGPRPIVARFVEISDQWITFLQDKGLPVLIVRAQDVKEVERGEEVRDGETVSPVTQAVRDFERV